MWKYKKRIKILVPFYKKISIEVELRSFYIKVENSVSRYRNERAASLSELESDDIETGADL